MRTSLRTLSLIINVTLLTIASSCDTKSRPEVNNQESGEGFVRTEDIIGGDVINDISLVPWQVGLLEPKANIDCFCGGSIINDRWILTAAHCLYYTDWMGRSRKRTAAELYIFANSNNLNFGGEVFDVINIIEHPNYNKSNLDNDIALLELKSPISLQNVNQQIAIPNNTQYRDLNQDGNQFFISGWGATGVNGDNYPNILRRTSVSIQNHNTCKQNYRSNNSAVTDNMICAADPGKDTCSGDSGGPLYVDIGGRGILLGITSWGSEPCADADLYGVYTNVFNYSEWINQNCNSCLDVFASL